MVSLHRAAFLMGMVMVVGCGPKPVGSESDNTTSEDVQQDIGQAINTTVEYSQEAKDKFQETLNTKLKTLDGEIVRLREKGSNLKEEAKENWEKTMSDLEKKRESLHARLEEAGRSNADAWEEARNGAESAWKELEQSFKVAASKY